MKCGAALHVGAKFEEHATFLCDLEENHDGLHVETGALKRNEDGTDTRPYTISWIGDDRDACEHCGKLESDLPICGRCSRFVCRACFGERVKWADPCLACKDEPEKLE